ncbi:MAG TPA: EAL domain-containing protein [Gaiellaceae bacterium]|nr:EAL domain-containing protein [Gaiellaceae bacterium]
MTALNPCKVAADGGVVPLRSAIADRLTISIALREIVVLVGLLWVALDTGIAHPFLAAMALAIEAVLAALTLAQFRVVGLSCLAGAFSTFSLVIVNGGMDSRLLLLWVAITASSALATGLAGVAVPAISLACVAPTLLSGGANAVFAFTGAAAICTVCVGAARSHTRTIARLEQETTTDSLTGVNNRLALDRQIAHFLSVPRPRGALVFIDLDGFREINRTQGHATADRLLKAVGAALSRTFSYDFVGRVGGDEFVLVIDRRRDPLAVAQHALRVIAEAGAELRITATAGVACVPEHGTRADEVLAASDQALRWGKADGKARAVLFDPQRASASPEIGQHEIERLWLEDRISIEVQPIVDLRLGRVRGYEALARFNVEGDNSPLRWFALADRAGLRAELEFACFERALRLYDERPNGTYLSVNLSPDLLELSQVKNALDALTDLRGLVLELTEEAVIDDYEHLAGVLAPHVERGLRIAVDDFGAGQANLRHAWSILPRFIKLDRTLVSRLDSDDARRALVGSIVAYAEQVGASLIAEGVETTAELNALCNLNVSYAQGFRLAAPASPWPAIDIDALLAAEGAISTSSRDPDVLLAKATETAGSLQKRFVINQRATAAILQDETGRVVGLLTRNRLLVTLGIRFGFALYGDRSAIAVADTDFMWCYPGTNREELITLAMGRDDTRRYDPIIVVDNEKRFLSKLTIQELLEPGIESGNPSAGPSPAPAARLHTQLLATS